MNVYAKSPASSIILIASSLVDDYALSPEIRAIISKVLTQVPVKGDVLFQELPWDRTDMMFFISFSPSLFFLLTILKNSRKGTMTDEG